MKRMMIVLLGLSLTGCFSETVNDNFADNRPHAKEAMLKGPEEFDKAIVIRCLDDIDLFFRIWPLSKEKGQTVLMIDVFSPSKSFDSLSMTERRINHFFMQIKKSFPDTRPDKARFTHYDVLMRPIFSIEFERDKLANTPSYYRGEFKLLDSASAFTQINKPLAEKMLGRYCQDTQQQKSRFCQKNYAEQQKTKPNNTGFGLPERGSALLKD